MQIAPEKIFIETVRAVAGCDLRGIHSFDFFLLLSEVERDQCIY